MDIQRRNQLTREIFEEELIPILTSKGHDYSGEDDVFSNFHDFGLTGIVVRIGDKYHRLKNILRAGKRMVQDETIEDTLKDLINYGFIGLIYWREYEKAKREHTEMDEGAGKKAEGIAPFSGI